jgi:glycosyltransferase involved in cell wall biosynthesis
MLDELNKSTLMKNKNNIALPNPIDTKYYRNISMDEAKSQLGLDITKKYILFSAMNSTTDKRKGFTELYHAFQKMSVHRNVELLVIGGNRNEELDVFKFPVQYMGFIDSWKTIKLIYSAVDMMIAPSLQENLSNTIMECLSCGTPVVAFDIGGNSDMISHKQNGYLADISDPSGLSDGIQWILKNSDKNFSKYARASVIEKFDYNVVVNKYLRLYESLLP